MAYTIACLGVTENDWETLGKQALESLDLEVAKKAYTRLKDLRHLELITDLEQRKNRDEDQVLIADIAAFQVQMLKYKWTLNIVDRFSRPSVYFSNFSSCIQLLFIVVNFPLIDKFTITRVHCTKLQEGEMIQVSRR